MASVNHSTESNTSSLQRSGLNMSVGDTKSIVLALQALQGKIRRLEQDRNHHQDQYERALQAHEAYKHDMEHQLEQERVHHRQREKELQEMVQRATAERAKMQTTLEESRKDLGTFRTELEEMLIRECDAAQKRESALSSEVDKLRLEVEEQQKKHRALLASIDELRAEKEAALDTNHHLEQAIQELMRRCSGQGADRSYLRNGDSSRTMEDRRKRGGGGGRGGHAYTGAAVAPFAGGAAMERNYRSSSCRRVADGRQRGDGRPISAPRSSSARRTYRDPTYCSIQRDVRRDGAGPLNEGGGPYTNANANSSSDHIKSHSHTTLAGARSQPAGPMDGRRGGAMAEVYRELQEELKHLHQQYKETVERAAGEEISPEVVTAALNRIATLMDRKTEQIRLIKEAQRDLAAANAVVEIPTSRPVSATKQRRSPPVGSDKTTQRNLIFNELRSLFSQQRS